MCDETRARCRRRACEPKTAPCLICARPVTQRFASHSFTQLHSASSRNLRHGGAPSCAFAGRLATPFYAYRGIQEGGGSPGQCAVPGQAVVADSASNQGSLLRGRLQRRCNLRCLLVEAGVHRLQTVRQSGLPVRRRAGWQQIARPGSGKRGRQLLCKASLFNRVALLRRRPFAVPSNPTPITTPGGRTRSRWERSQPCLEAAASSDAMAGWTVAVIVICLSATLLFVGITAYLKVNRAVAAKEAGGGAAGVTLSATPAAVEAQPLKDSV